MDGELLTDSLTLANVFGKSHYHVTKKIQEFKCSQWFNATNFRAVEYTDSKGQHRPMVELTKNGMMFLVMGFTGKKADSVREAFIEEFG